MNTTYDNLTLEQLKTEASIRGVNVTEDKRKKQSWIDALIKSDSIKEYERRQKNEEDRRKQLLGGAYPQEAAPWDSNPPPPLAHGENAQTKGASPQDRNGSVIENHQKKAEEKNIASSDDLSNPRSLLMDRSRLDPDSPDPFVQEGIPEGHSSCVAFVAQIFLIIFAIAISLVTPLAISGLVAIAKLSSLAINVGTNLVSPIFRWRQFQLVDRL